MKACNGGVKEGGRWWWRGAFRGASAGGIVDMAEKKEKKGNGERSERER